MKTVTALLLVVGTACECLGLLALSDRWRGRVPWAGLLLPAGFAAWIAGATLLVLSRQS